MVQRMSSTLGARVVEEEYSAEVDADRGVPSVVRRHVASAAARSDWLAPAPAFTATKRELWAVLLASAVLHAGVASAAYRHEGAPAEKHVSRVEIDVARPPERPKPPPPTPAVVPPPPPPQVTKLEARPLAAKPEPLIEEATPTSPSDTGSSAPAEEGGELHAGSGGLGLEPPAPPAPPAPVVQAPAKAPVLQAREGANYLKNPRPAYPLKAKRDGLSGTTLLRLWVQPSGKPGAVTVQKSSGHEVLDDAAKEAVSKWAFVPATQGGAPVGGFVTVPIVFRLQ